MLSFLFISVLFISLNCSYRIGYRSPYYFPTFPQSFIFSFVHISFLFIYPICSILFWLIFIVCFFLFFVFFACVNLLTSFSVHSFVISFNVRHLFLLSSSFSSLFPNHPFSPSSPLSFPFSFSSLLYKRTHPSLPAPFDPIRTMLTLPNGGIPPL